MKRTYAQTQFRPTFESLDEALWYWTHEVQTIELLPSETWISLRDSTPPELTQEVFEALVQEPVSQNLVSALFQLLVQLRTCNPSFLQRVCLDSKYQHEACWKALVALLYHSKFNETTKEYERFLEPFLLELRHHGQCNLQRAVSHKANQLLNKFVAVVFMRIAWRRFLEFSCRPDSGYVQRVLLKRLSRVY